jgi:hypothetical protein
LIEQLRDCLQEYLEAVWRGTNGEFLDVLSLIGKTNGYFGGPQ